MLERRQRHGKMHREEMSVHDKQKKSTLTFSYQRIVPILTG